MAAPAQLEADEERREERHAPAERELPGVRAVHAPARVALHLGAHEGGREVRLSLHRSGVATLAGS